MTERISMADIYPANEQTCARCYRNNDAGESFRLWTKMPYWCKDVCPECYKELVQQEDAERVKSIRESEDEQPDETQNTNEVICPYCGYETCDSWEYREDEDEIECEECQHKFRYVREVSVSYSTSRIGGDEE